MTLQPMTLVHEPGPSSSPRAAATARVHRIEADALGGWLRVEHGRVWATGHGAGVDSAVDHWLSAGGQLWLPPRSSWVIEGVADACARLCAEGSSAAQPPLRRRLAAAGLALAATLAGALARLRGALAA